MKLCVDCKKNKFEVKAHARYVRKYCNVCSAKRKKMWDSQWKVKFEEGEE